MKFFSIFGKKKKESEEQKPAEREKLDADAWYNKGVALGDLGRYDDAIRCIDEALKINPRYAEAWTGKGSASGNLGRVDDAIRCFDEAIRINPGDAKAWNNKGIALCMLGQYDEALKNVKQAIRINPNFAVAHQLEELILEELKR